MLLKKNSSIKTSESRIAEKVPGKPTGAPFDSLGSFRMYELQEIILNNNQSLFTTGSGNFHVIFCHEEFDLFKTTTIKNDQEKIYKIMFGGMATELSSKNSSGYYCIFDKNFSSLIGDPFCIKHGNECIINVPGALIEKFKLIFDLIYSLFKSSTEYKKILIASYLLVVLKEANTILKQFYPISHRNGRPSADNITRRFKELIARYYLEKQKAKV